MRRISTIAVPLLAAAGFWIYFGDTSPSTRPSPTLEAALKEEREFRERLRANGRIVFTRDRNLWVMEGDGSGQIRLTTSGRDDRPAWSSDGSRVAFLRRDGADHDSGRLHVLDLASGAVRKLSDTPALADAAPRWSPDDRAIAFTHALRDDGVLHHEVRLLEVASGKEAAIGGGEHPSWSPEGKLIASSLGIVDPAAPEPSARIRIPEGDDFTWSADGRRLAFLRATRGGPYATALHAMEVGGEFFRSLTRHDRIDEAPAWAPDGRRVAFHSRAVWDALGTDVEIGIVGADGAELRSLGTGREPVWTPDGRGLIFTALQDDDRPSQIWYVDADGTNRVNLSSSAASDREPQIRRR